MKDIAPELIEKIEADFKKRMNMSEPIKDLFMKIKSGTATYKDAQNYAVKVSEIMSEVLNRHLSSDILPDGRLYYNIAKRIFNQTLGKNGTYRYISQYAEQVQGIINKNAGIGIKAIKADINQDRIDGIIDIVSGKEKFDDIKYMLKEPVINYGQAIVDDTVRVNINFHGKAGLKPKVVRTSANPCQWCDKLQGVYEYPDVPKDVYRRHRYCRCLVTYEEGDKRPENVHTKKFATPEELEHRKTIGLETPLKKDPKKIISNIGNIEKSKRGDIIELRNALNKTNNYEIYNAIINNSKIFAGLSPEAIKSELERAGLKIKPLSKGSLKGMSFDNGGGFKVNFGEDGVLLYHPASRSHHGGAYYKISSGRGVKRYDLKGKEIK